MMKHYHTVRTLFTVLLCTELLEVWVVLPGLVAGVGGRELYKEALMAYFCF